MSRTTIVATAFAVAAAAVLPFGSPAGAAPTQPGILGIGTQTTVRAHLDYTDMKPIPGTDADNTGIAEPGDNIAAICRSFDNNNVSWVLTINRNGHAGGQYSNTTGYIRLEHLLPGLVVGPCATPTFLGPADHYAGLASGLVQADMKPIAGTDAPDTGLFKQGDLAAIYCRLPDNNGMVWQLAVNLYGHAGQQYAGTAGFLPFAATNDSAAAVECGAT